MRAIPVPRRIPNIPHSHRGGMFGSSGPASSVRQYIATLVFPPVRTFPSSRAPVAPSLLPPQLASPPVSTLHNKARGGEGGEEAGFFLSALAELTLPAVRWWAETFQPRAFDAEFLRSAPDRCTCSRGSPPRDHPAPSPGMDRVTLPERAQPNPPESKRCQKQPGAERTRHLSSCSLLCQNT